MTVTVTGRGASLSGEAPRLPGGPGRVRTFLRNHPRLVDGSIAGLCAALALIPLWFLSPRVPELDQIGIQVAGLTALVACIAQLWRRRWPVVVFVLAVFASGASVVAWTGSSGLLVGVSAYSTVVYRSARAGLVALACGVTAIAATAGTASAMGMIEPAWAIVGTVGEAFTGVIGALIGINVRNRHRYVEALIDRSRRLEIERDQQGRLAASAERERIARELHDIVSHNLTVMVALAEGAAATTDPHGARTAIAQVATTGRSALRDMRAMLGVLRDDTAPLAPIDDDAIGDAVERARRAGYPVTLTWMGPENMPQPILLAVVRVVQEGLTNAMRHSRGATGIHVRIATTATMVEVSVLNDGVPAAPTVGGQRRDGYGTRGLRERVEHVGGTITIGPQPPGRWQLHAVLPLPAPAEEES